MNRQIILTPHDPAWTQHYREEAATLTAVFGKNLIDSHHIGSTAIPGIQAKPIIDIMPVVWDLTPVAGLNEVMAAHGYIYKGENGIAGRRYFRKGSDLHHSHHIHVYQTGHANIAHQLLFRDYLRSHLLQAQAYDRLKTELAQACKADPAAYTAAKSGFIQTLIQQAIEAQRKRERPLRTLITPRLQLIALSLPQLESCLQDPSLLATNLDLSLENETFHPVMRQATHVKISKMRLVAVMRHHWNTYWLIIRRDTQCAIGTIGFKGQPDLSRKVEIGYGLSPQHRHHGFMTEAAQTLVRWALAQPDCNTVFATTQPDNIASHHVLQKVGMVRAGELDGEWRWEIKAER